MSEKKSKKLRLRLTPEQKQIVLEHPFGAEMIRNFVQSKINENEPCNEKLSEMYDVKITPEMKNALEYKTNISQHIRWFIENKIKS